MAALADLLLDLGRAAGVIQLVGDTANDQLRLRLAEAWQRTQPGGKDASALKEQLGDAFAVAHARGDELHLREQARFELRLRRDAPTALRLARRNWEIQKEPADLRLLLEAARAAGDTTVEAETREWARRNQPATWKHDDRTGGKERADGPEVREIQEQKTSLAERGRIPKLWARNDRRMSYLRHPPVTTLDPQWFGEVPSRPEDVVPTTSSGQPGTHNLGMRGLNVQALRPPTAAR